MFDFDALNPAFTDFESEIPELDMELLEGEFEDETDYMDENGLWDADDEEVEEPDGDFPMYLEYDEG